VFRDRGPGLKRALTTIAPTTLPCVSLAYPASIVGACSRTTGPKVPTSRSDDESGICRAFDPLGLIVKRKQRAFSAAGLTWIVERSVAWLGRYRRLSKNYEFRVQTSAALIDIAATRLIPNRVATA